jgi:hypothetical protein
VAASFITLSHYRVDASVGVGQSITIMIDTDLNHRE